MLEEGNIKVITLPEPDVDNSLVLCADQPMGPVAHQMPRRQRHLVGRAVPLQSDQLEMQQTLLPGRRNFRSHDAAALSLECPALCLHFPKVLGQQDCEQQHLAATQLASTPKMIGLQQCTNELCVLSTQGCAGPTLFLKVLSQLPDTLSVGITLPSIFALARGAAILHNPVLGLVCWEPEFHIINLA